MAKLNMAPTKANLLSVKDQLSVAADGYDLLEQKREIIVMELMRTVEKVKLLENEIDKRITTAYPALKKMLMTVGGDQVKRISGGINYEYQSEEKTVTVAGKNFRTLSVKMPQKKLFYSYLDSFADVDNVMNEFFELLKLLTELASIRTIVWHLAQDVKKTQRRVNALDKMVIPSTKETISYIESVLEERERENVFVLKSLKNRQNKD